MCGEIFVRLRRASVMICNGDAETDTASETRHCYVTAHHCDVSEISKRNKKKTRDRDFQIRYLYQNENEKVSNLM